MSRRRLLHAGAALALVALLSWAGGLVWFIHAISRPMPPPPIADGIVALTGGADRVETGLRLLRDHQARWLLLSGIGGGAELPSLAQRAKVAASPLADEVTLGRQATSTRGNALETAAWVQQHTIRSLIVVTAYYHMPRALTELRRALPGVTLYPLPVLLDDPRQPAPYRLIVEEYSKYLLAAVGVSTLLPSRDAPPHGGRPL